MIKCNTLVTFLLVLFCNTLVTSWSLLSFSSGYLLPFFMAVSCSSSMVGFRSLTKLIPMPKWVWHIKIFSELLKFFLMPKCVWHTRKKKENWSPCQDTFGTMKYFYKKSLCQSKFGTPEKVSKKIWKKFKNIFLFEKKFIYLWWRNKGTLQRFIEKI